jgi:hypothetical protein
MQVGGMQAASSPPIKNVIYPKVCNSEHFAIQL